MKYHGQRGLHGQVVIKDVVQVYNNDTAHVSVKETVDTGDLPEVYTMIYKLLLYSTAINKVEYHQVKILPMMTSQHYVLQMITLSPVERIHQRKLNDLLVV